MYHYVYTLMFNDDMKYIGMRSTTVLPELDILYLGSGAGLPKDRSPKTCGKTIVEIFPTRKGASDYEQDLIIEYGAVASEEFYNRRLRTHDKHGSELSMEHRRMISACHKGRDRTAYGKKYTGVGRTPAQKAGSIRAAEKVRGTKDPAKGSPGITNQGFVPWYYITPEGVRVEVHNETKAEYAHKFGFTVRQLMHRFHYSNEHKEGRYHPFTGWIFGNL